MEIEDFTKCTLPSANRKLAPPGWLLLAFWYCPSAAVLCTVPSKHQVNVYWLEVGGTIVLNEAKPPTFSAHRNPLKLYIPVVASGFLFEMKADWQAWRSATTAWGFWKAL